MTRTAVRKNATLFEISKVGVIGGESSSSSIHRNHGSLKHVLNEFCYYLAVLFTYECDMHKPVTTICEAVPRDYYG